AGAQFEIGAIAGQATDGLQRPRAVVLAEARQTYGRASGLQVPGHELEHRALAGPVDALEGDHPRAAIAVHPHSCTEIQVPTIQWWTKGLKAVTVPSGMTSWA